MDTTIIRLKGEEKSRLLKQCSSGPDGKVQKQQIGPSAQQESQGGLKGRAVAKKKGEITDYMKQAVALVQQYVPPNPQLIQAAQAARTISLGRGPAEIRLDFIAI